MKWLNKGEFGRLRNSTKRTESPACQTFDCNGRLTGYGSILSLCLPQSFEIEKKNKIQVLRFKQA